MDDEERVNVLEQITSLLLSLGFHANQYGYRYLRNAVYQVMTCPILIDSVTKLLYPAVAKEYGVSPVKVERAIRTSIETAWSETKKDALHLLFEQPEEYEKQRPTNTEFIEAVVKYLNRENTEIEDIYKDT